MCRVWNMSGFWIFQDFQYARVHNFQGYTGLTYFRKYDRVLNMRRDAIMQGFWIFQDSEYANFPHMRRLHKVPNMPEYGSIMPNKLFWLWHCSKYAWSMFQTLQTHHVYSTWKRPFPRCFNEEYTWCDCKAWFTCQFHIPVFLYF